MSAHLTHRLSANDAVFLYWERPEQPFHVCECMVYDGDVTLAEIKRMLEERMHLLPRYRQRIVFAPLQVGHPTWHDDPEFDLDNHLAEATLPAPGDDRTLSLFCGQLFGGLIDREHPLWHLTLIHGHESGHPVMFLKLHHAMVDGVSSVQLIEVLHSAERGSSPPEPPDVEWQPSPLPSRSTLLLHGLADSANSAVELARSTAQSLRPGNLSTTVERAKSVARVFTKPTTLQGPPETPFNKPISAARDFSWLELPFDEANRVRKGYREATINDFVLAILSGGLGRAFRRVGHDPTGQVLRAMCPVSVRDESGRGAMGNQLSMIDTPLYVGITDPLERFDAQIDSMRRLKETNEAAGFRELITASDHYPAWLWKRIWSQWPMSFFPYNIVSTNVPGPRTPLYLGDHELLHWYPVGVNWTTSGLFLCTLSYREYLTLGLVADPKIVDDVWQVSDDLREAYVELKDAIETNSK